MGGRGAKALQGKGKKALRDMIKPKRGKVMPIDATKYGSLREAESVIRDLTKERALIYDNIGESPLQAFQGNESSVAMSPENLVPGNTLTHNHPDKIFGGTFSYADVANALTTGMKSTRAAGKEGNYYLRPTKNSRAEGFAGKLARDIPRLENAVQRRIDNVYKKAAEKKITYEQANRMIRTVAVGVLHSYYKRTAPQFGYVYGREKLNTSRR